MVDTATMRAVWCDDDTVHLLEDPEAIHWSDSVAIAVLCDEVDRLRAELQAERAMRLAEQSPIFSGDGRRFVEYRGDTKDS